jgi:hypothetical protein
MLAFARPGREERCSIKGVGGHLDRQSGTPFLARTLLRPGEPEPEAAVVVPRSLVTEPDAADLRRKQDALDVL